VLFSEFQLACLPPRPCWERKISFRIFRSIVAVIAIISTLTGLPVGYVTKGDAALASSILKIPLSRIAIGVIAAKFREQQPE